MSTPRHNPISILVQEINKVWKSLETIHACGKQLLSTVEDEGRSLQNYLDGKKKRATSDGLCLENSQKHLKELCLSVVQYNASTEHCQHKVLEVHRKLEELKKYSGLEKKRGAHVSRNSSSTNFHHLDRTKAHGYSRATARINDSPLRSTSGNSDLRLLLSLYQKEVQLLKEQDNTLGKNLIELHATYYGLVLDLQRTYHKIKQSYQESSQDCLERMTREVGYHQKYENARASLQTVEKELKNKESTIASLEQRNQKLQDLNNKLREQLTQTNGADPDKMKLQSQVKNSAAKRDSLLKHNRELQKDNESLRASVKHKDEQHRNRCRLLEAQYKNVINEKTLISAKYTELQNELAQKEKELKASHERMEAQSQLQNVASERDELLAKTRTLQEDNETLVLSIKHKDDQYQNRIAELKAQSIKDKIQYESQVSLLKNNTDKLKQRVTEVEGQTKNYYDSQISTLDNNTEKLKRRITELETSKESELQRMKAELRLQLDHQKKRYEDEISTLNANYQKLKQKHDELQAQNKKVSNERKSPYSESKKMHKGKKSAQPTVTQKDVEPKNQKRHGSQADQLINTGRYEELNNINKNYCQEIEELRQELKQKDEKCTELQILCTKFSEEKAKLDHSQDAVLQKDKELKSCQDQLQQCHIKHKNVEAKYNKEKASLTAMVTELQRNNDILQNKLSLKENELIASQERYKEKLSEERTKLSQDIVLQKEKELKSCQDQLKQCHTEYSELEEQLKRVLNEKSSLTDMYTELQTNNDGIEHKLAQIEKELKTSHERYKQLQIQNAKLSEERTKLLSSQDIVSHKLKELKTCKDELKQYHTNYSQLEAQLKDFLNEKSSLTTKVTELQKSDDILKQKLTQKEKELRTSHERLSVLETQLKEKTSLLQKTTEDFKSKLAQKDEELKTSRERYKELQPQSGNETLQVIVAQKDKELKHCKGELKKCKDALLALEEKSYQLTNAFTTAGEGSVLDISKRYRHLQHNKRSAAARAIKKSCGTDAREHICGQIMTAYEEAKEMTLSKARDCIDECLFKLHSSEDLPCEKELLQTCMILLSYVQKDEMLKNNAIHAIEEKLKTCSEKTLSALPQPVLDYYKELASLTWCAVARPIPMVMATQPDCYTKDFHDLKDGEDGDDGKQINYVYPVLYSSNEWPKQVAQEGRVVLKKQHT